MAIKLDFIVIQHDGAIPPMQHIRAGQITHKFAPALGAIGKRPHRRRIKTRTSR